MMNTNTRTKWFAALLAPLVWLTLLGCLLPSHHDHDPYDDTEEEPVEPCTDHHEWHSTTGRVEVLDHNQLSATFECNEIPADQDHAIEPYIVVQLEGGDLTSLYVRATTRDNETIWGDPYVDLSDAEVTGTTIRVPVRIELAEEYLNRDILVTASATVQSETGRFISDARTMFTPY